MSAPELHAIVAMASNRVIGRDGALPWHFPEDLRWFKRLTLGHPIIMGRKTWDSLPKKLPGRRNIVLSRTGRVAGVESAASLESLGTPLPTDAPSFVIGGAEIYRLLLPRCTELVVTHIRAAYDGDTEFPSFEDGFAAVETLAETDDFEIKRYRRRPTPPGA